MTYLEMDIRQRVVAATLRRNSRVRVRAFALAVLLVLLVVMGGPVNDQSAKQGKSM